MKLQIHLDNIYTVVVPISFVLVEHSYYIEKLNGYCLSPDGNRILLLLQLARPLILQKIINMFGGWKKIEGKNENMARI